MKIITGLDRDRIEKDAREQLVAQRRYRLRHGYVIPLGIPLHAARTPTVCDDCGETYWTNPDLWSPHLGCQRKSGKIGF